MVDPVPAGNGGKLRAWCYGESQPPVKANRWFAVVEKPELAKAPSNMSIVGRYVLSRISSRCQKTAQGPVMDPTD